MVTQVADLESWLAALVDARPEDQRMVSIQGIDVGLAHRRVRCTRHRVGLNWLSAFSHLNRTEATHRLANGPHARLHQPGDLVPAGPAPLDSPWTVTACRSARCKRPIVWAITESGARMPVDATPDPSGTVVLARAPEADDDAPPLALVLHNDQQLVESGERHTSHFATCRDAKHYRRRS